MTDRVTLQTDLRAFLGSRSDLDAAFPALLRLAQAMVDRKVRVRAMETVATLNATSATVSLPTDFISPISLTNGSATSPELRLVSANLLRYETIANSTGGPALAAIEGQVVRLEPPPTALAPADLTLVYFARFAALVDDSDSNWITLNAYDVMLYALLYIAGRRFRDYALADVSFIDFTRAVEELHEQENFARMTSANEIWRDIPPGGV